VIGPGLGRDPITLSIVAGIIAQTNTMLLFDADGLLVILNDQKILEGKTAILTPNHHELKRMLETFDITGSRDDGSQQLAERLKCTIVSKGEYDVIASESAEDRTVCDEVGSARRIGGQGDILVGIMGTFLAWSKDPHVAAVSACFLLRRASNAAFEKYGRGMLTSHILEELAPAFREAFESDEL